jgi:hypothetical protein
MIVIFLIFIVIVVVSVINLEIMNTSTSVQYNVHCPVHLCEGSKALVITFVNVSVVSVRGF